MIYAAVFFCANRFFGKKESETSFPVHVRAIFVIIKLGRLGAADKGERK